MRMDDALSSALPSAAWKASPISLARWMTRGRYQRTRHGEAIQQLIERAVLDGGVRAIVSMPPRHGKSELVSRWGCVWAFDCRPDLNLILASYGADLAEGWSRKVRDTLAEGELAATVAPGASRAALWSTSQGGQCLATGVGGAMTGHGGDLVIIDDPLKNREEADSPARREKVWDWWTSTVYTRLSPDASVILVMTRWHHDDLAGRLLEQDRQGIGEGWEVLELPALAREDEPDPLGRQPGEALWPERFSTERLLRTRRAIGERDWSALYDQRPTASGAGFFPPAKEWARYRERPPATWFQAITVSIDTKLKDGPKTDPLSVLIWGKEPGADRYWMLDELNIRTGWFGMADRLRALLATYPTPSDIIVEDKALGPALIELLRRERLAPSVLEYRPTASKEARATVAGRYVEAGALVYPAREIAPWIVDYERELEQFPVGRHDDRVDATSQLAITALVDRRLRLGVARIGPALDRLAGRSRVR